MSSIAIFGVGAVGSLVARSLASTPGISELWLFARNAERLRTGAMDLRIAAENAGNSRFRLHTASLDLAFPDRVAELLSEARPDVIVNTTTMRSWFTLATALPSAVWKDLYGRVRFGPWLPLNLAPCLQLMKAHNLVGMAAPVVNVCSPDAVNPTLAKIGLTPAMGAGNSEIIASVLRIAAAELLQVDVAEINVSLIAHHFHLANLDYETSWRDRAFWYRIRYQGRDITADLDSPSFQACVRRNCPHGSSVPAAVSAARTVRRILGAEAGMLVHCSSPNGMAGGYDVRFHDGAPQLALPDGMTFEEAVAINNAAVRGDGIEEIMPNGAVRFRAEEASAMREVLGYDCPVLHPGEIEERGRELLARFDALAARLKVVSA